MSKVFISDEENVIDLAIRTYGSVDAVLDLIRDNALDLESDLVAGTTAEINEVRAEELALLPPAVYTLPKSDRSVVVISEGQSSVDVALQEYGSIEGLLSVLRDNSLGVDEYLKAGQEFMIRPSQIVRHDVVTWMKNRSMRINTGNKTKKLRIFSRQFSLQFK